MTVTIHSNSRLHCYQECPQKYYYRHILKRKPAKDRTVLTFGTAYHLLLEHFWLGGIEQALEHFDEAVKDLDEVDAAKVGTLFAHYPANLPAHSHDEVLGMEQSFDVPVIDSTTGRALYGHRLRGKIDLLLGIDKKVWVVDHKTTAKDITGDSPYWDALRMDSQLVLYALMEGASGVIYDVTRKPQLRLSSSDKKTAREEGIEPIEAYRRRVEERITSAPEEWYQWRAFPLTHDQLLEAASNLVESCRLFEMLTSTGLYPRHSGSCIGHYGACDYLEVCAGRAEIEDDSQFRDNDYEPGAGHQAQQGAAAADLRIAGTDIDGLDALKARVLGPATEESKEPPPISQASPAPMWPVVDFPPARWPSPRMVKDLHRLINDNGPQNDLTLLHMLHTDNITQLLDILPQLGLESAEDGLFTIEANLPNTETAKTKHDAVKTLLIEHGPQNGEGLRAEIGIQCLHVHDEALGIVMESTGRDTWYRRSQPKQYATPADEVKAWLVKVMDGGQSVSKDALLAQWRKAHDNPRARLTKKTLEMLGLRQLSNERFDLLESRITGHE